MVIKKTFVKLIILIGCLFFIVSCSDPFKILSDKTAPDKTAPDKTAPTVTGVTIDGEAVTNGGTIDIEISATYDVVITATDDISDISGYQITTTNAVPTTWRNRNTISYTFLNNDIYVWVKDVAGNISSEFNVTASASATTTVYLRSDGVDDATGTELAPVKTMAEALALLGGSSSLSSANTIWVMDTIDVATNTIWDYNGLNLKRYKTFKGALINVTGGILNLRNITIDGQGGTVEADEALITIDGSIAKLALNGAILQNNNNLASNGGGVMVSNSGTVTINGGTITNNTASSGGGIYVADRGLVNLGAGTAITISGNTKIDGTINNIAYTNSLTESPIKVTSVITVGKGTTIGLSPTSIVAGSIFVEADSSIIAITNFSLDSGGNLRIEGDNLVTADDYGTGDTGPGGGLVFYYSGKRYEVSDNLGSMNWNAAIAKGNTYNGGGYSDWYLPNKEELNAVYVNLRTPNYITDDNGYWSSSEHNINYAWYQNFSNGSQYTSTKTSINYYVDYVRVVRAF